MGPGGYRKRLKQLSSGKKVCFGLVFLAGLCLVGELGLRLRQLIGDGVWQVPGWLREADPPTTVWHPFLRSVPRPGTTWAVVQGDETARIEINSLGFRSPEFEEDKPTETFRIACLGGSVVYDTRVDLEQSWTMQLQARLQERFPRRPIEVVNAGVPGRTSADSLVTLALRVLPLHPDLVILLHGVNDQKPNRYPGFKADYSHWYLRDPSAFESLFDAVIDKSLLGSHLRFRLKRLVNRSWRENYRGEDLERFDTVSEPGLLAFRSNLVSMIGMLEARDVPVVIATVGHSLAINADWSPADGTPNPLLYSHATQTLAGIAHGFAEYNRINREVAALHATALVDLERLLPSGPDNYQDEVHFTVRGSAAVARIFLAEVPWDQWLGGDAPMPAPAKH